MKVLVTGAGGMIGSQLVKGLVNAGYEVIGVDKKPAEGITQVDLANKAELERAAESADRIIHLAALAHTEGEPDLSWERYKSINVDCAKNVFDVAGDRPVLFISTVDVFGFYDGKEPVSDKTEVRPVSNYGKSKALAEEECKKLKHFTIFRLSPVYTKTVKRDIQKRYYLKYPYVAYQIGKGTAFEVLSIENAVDSMVGWCKEEPKNDVRIIKDSEPMWTPDYIRDEKAEGRAKVVLRFPQWMVGCGYVTLRILFGDGEKIYLLNKAVHPLRSENIEWE